MELHFFYEITDGQHVSRSAHSVLWSLTFGLGAVRQRKLRLPEVRPRVLDREAVSYDPATAEHY